MVLYSAPRFSTGTPVSPLLKNQHFTWFVLIMNFIVLIVTFAFKRAVTHVRYVVKKITYLRQMIQHKQNP